MIGSWITWSAGHTIKHKVIGEDRDVWITNCQHRIGKSQAQPAQIIADDLNQCQGCAHGADLSVGVSHEKVAASS